MAIAIQLLSQIAQSFQAYRSESAGLDCGVIVLSLFFCSILARLLWCWCVGEADRDHTDLAAKSVLGQGYLNEPLCQYEIYLKRWPKRIATVLDARYLASRMAKMGVVHCRHNRLTLRQ